MSTRIRPDKQVQTAPGQGYSLVSDQNGELQFVLLSTLLPSGAGVTTDVKSIDSLALNGSTLVLSYTDTSGKQSTKNCDLTTLAVDVKVTGAILSRPDAHTYTLQLSQSDGTTVTVNLTDLLAIVTENSSDIILSGKGTTESPLTATLTEEARSLLAAKHRTDEFTGLITGNTVRLSYSPVYPFPVHVYRNGLRQASVQEWRYSVADPLSIVLGGAPFGANGQSETVVVDYMTTERTEPPK